MNEKDPKENVDDMHWRDATKDEIVELKKCLILMIRLQIIFE